MQLLFTLTKGELLWRYLLLPSHAELLVVAVGRAAFKPCPPRGSEQRRHNAQWVRINIAAGIKLCLPHCFCCGPCYFFLLKQYIILKNAVCRGGRVTREGISERKKKTIYMLFFLFFSSCRAVRWQNLYSRWWEREGMFSIPEGGGSLSLLLTWADRPL